MENFTSVPVPTAVPAFVGYTEKALDGERSLLNIPARINSLDEFHTYFGGAPVPQFSVGDSVTYIRRHTLYYNLLFFFANRGSTCYIVSVGNFTGEPDAQGMIGGINALLQEQEPTIVVAPEAVNLSEDDCWKVQQAMLHHCGGEMKNRFAILDIFRGDKDRNDAVTEDVILNFRKHIGDSFLGYGAVYYPWLITSIVQKEDINLSHIDKESLPALQKKLMDQLVLLQIMWKDAEKWISQITEVDSDKAVLHEILARLAIHQRLSHMDDA